MVIRRRSVRRFVIIFPGRSGGTLLATSLDAHPEVRVKTEPMGLLVDRGAPAQRAWIDDWFRSPIRGRRRAVGFSTKVGDLCDPDATADLLRGFDVRVIALDRRNAVKLTVSIIRARQLRVTTGRWNRFSPDVHMDATEIDADEFDTRLGETMHRRAETDAFVTRLALPTLHLDYSELLLDVNATLDRVCEFVDVKPAPLVPPTLKNTSDDLRDAVLNFSALRARYVGTQYEAMFDEVLEPPG